MRIRTRRTTAVTAAGIALLLTLGACGSDNNGEGTSAADTAAAAGSSAAGAETTGADTAGSDTAASGTAGSDTAGSDTAGSDTAGSAPAESGSQDFAGKKLTVWIMEGTNPDATPFFADVAKDFKAQTGADLDVQFQPWADAHDKFTTAIAGGTTPDVAEIGTTWTPEFAQAGALEDLTQQVAPMKDNLVQGLVDAGTMDGKLYGMPWYAGVRSFVYNKDVFEKAGVQPPTTWDELVAAGEKIKSAVPDVVPFAVAGDCSYCMMPFIWGAGGDVATQQDGKWTSTIDSPESQAGLTFYTDLALKQGLSTPAAATWKETDLLKNFESGKLAMVITGNWTITKITTDAPDMKGNLGAFAIPGKTADKLSPSFLGGSHLGIFKASQNKELAWKFIELMSSDKYAQQWAQSSNFFPGIKSLLDETAKSADPLIAPFAKQMVEAGKSMPVTPDWGKIEGAKVLTKMLQSVLTGKASVADATKTAAGEMNDSFGG
ncbi:sugar ABC transporter substrate-binding protein [Nakamurella lactea]|uniref:sugar ABC transporter substrate-binding protein n=1 Tax=Nakamurella lactea TaxID=459515 RepID=UPI0004112A9C|nr:sugar ABC transporter substrate-binding protein [Nakamurella lactea]